MKFNSNSLGFYIYLDDYTPCYYIENILKDVVVKQEWIKESDNYGLVTLDYEPFNAKGYKLRYVVEKINNKDNNLYGFIEYLCKETVDKINNMNSILSSTDNEDYLTEHWLFKPKKKKGGKEINNE